MIILLTEFKIKGMKNYLIIAALLILPFALVAQDKKAASLTDGSKLLFKTTKSKLTIDEKNSLFKQLNLTLSKNKKQFMSGEFEVAVACYVTDMNKDSIEEVFIVMQSTALYGNTGEAFSLYIKNSSGSFEKQAELGEGIAMILISKRPDYPDIAVGGPGFEFPAYRWDGKKYKYLKKIKDADLQSKKIKYMDLASCSRSYTDTLK